jgi:hypothetical protein
MSIPLERLGIGRDSLTFVRSLFWLPEGLCITVLAGLLILPSFASFVSDLSLNDNAPELLVDVTRIPLVLVDQIEDLSASRSAL